MSDIPDDIIPLSSPPVPEEVAEFERGLKEAIDKVTGQWDAEIFATTSAAPTGDNTLTLEKVNEAYKEVMKGQDDPPWWWVPWERTPNHWIPSSFGLDLASDPDRFMLNRWQPMLIPGLPVYTNPYLGTPSFPAMPPFKKGPYYQRRIKRWRRAHRGFTIGNGKYFVVDQREVWCHPDDLPKLKQALNTVRPADTKETK